MSMRTGLPISTGIKLDPNTDGPPGYLGDPYLPLYISFTATTGEHRPIGTLHYALGRTSWQSPLVSDADRSHLRSLALERVSADIAAIDRGEKLPWLSEEGRLYLPASH